MKTSILIFAMAAIFFAACSDPKSTESSATKILSSTDTIGLAQFQQWKQQQEWRNQQIIETNGINENADDGLSNYAGSGPARNYSNNNTYYDNEPTVRQTPRTTKTSTARKSSQTRRVGAGSSAGRSSTGQGQGTAKTTRKKGWSHAAKGTVIGAGSGAVLGAIISKKKGKGAIIGGIIGAGGGYVLGRMKDKKVGRY